MTKLRHMKKSTRTSFFTYGLVIVAFLIIQILRGTVGIGSLLEGQLIPICAYIVMAVSLNLVVGISGELSLGHAGFMSVGAFAGCAMANGLQNLVPSEPLRLVIAILFGALMAALAGFLIGIPVLRLNGDYLAIVTLAFGEIIKTILTNLYIGVDANGLQASFVNDTTDLAEGGIALIKGPMGVSNTSARISTFVAGFILVMVALIVVFNLVNSRAGRAIMATRDNRIAAESVGISVTKYKLMAFTVSAALAGAAGTLYGCSQITFSANKFDFNTSILILVFVVLGGLGNMWGSVIAATALTILPEALRQFSDYRMLVYAIVLILVMLATNSPAIRSFFLRIVRGGRNEDGPSRSAKKEAAK
ncbi:branched-chain amino acid ABC transporter permease [Pseudoflavonifractor phocaeensis]|uniref:branched-chain amino acid ABC transporter permease n=1 Tax=Pseudoflavonifractor phocaeensis TaxID=1870988 RepID=UPI0019595749|nr:branched-chain amino acid ABC transporter permease [Pseudoflavonifractor phocaeensis]MBM6938977.1 branched-chain amino acid ABC transporter permease [Pseudoflavonifractor phocaeensis]